LLRQLSPGFGRRRNIWSNIQVGQIVGHDDD
jgi:hypothetical protein